MREEERKTLALRGEEERKTITLQGEEERKTIALRGEEERKTMSAITPPSDPSALAGLLGDASTTEPAGH
jgi:hypothetical protein